MSQVHLHLVITHLPIFGSLLGAFVLGYGIWKKSDPTKTAAYFIFLVSAIGAGIAYLTGEGAEESVERVQGVSERMIEQHEDAAKIALVSLVILGALSLLALLVKRLKASLINQASIVVLLFSLISFGLVARTGYLGGQIRHTEIAGGAGINNNTGAGEEKDDD